VLASTFVELRTAFRTKIEKIWGDLPNPEAVSEAQERAAASVSESIQARRLDTESALDQTSKKLATALLSLASGPRLTESFASVANAYRADHSESATPNQKIVELALQSITDGTVKFVGRDIYIGTNVAAMGPSASAHNTVFRASK
jgi:hypothetical protein